MRFPSLFGHLFFLRGAAAFQVPHLSHKPSGTAQAPVTVNTHTKLSAATLDDVVATTESPMSFDQMRLLDSRLQLLLDSAPEDIMNFYEPHLKSFSVKPGNVQKISLTSSCYSLLALLTTGDSGIYDSVAQFDLSLERSDETDNRVSLRQVIQALMSAEWRETDLFQVPLLLYTALKTDSKRAWLSGACTDEQLASQIRKLISAVLSARPQRRNGPSQPYSEYIIFQCCRAMAELQDTTPVPTSPDFCDEAISPADYETGIGGLPVSASPDGAAGTLALALARCAEVSFNELCRQLAYRSADDQTSFDVMMLAYSLLTYITSTKSLAGTAGRELVPGLGPSAGTQTNPANQRLVRSALAAFFDEQQEGGLWEKGQPIYKSFRTQGRNVGNAFVFAVDTLGSLLEQLPAEEFRPYLTKLQKTLDWIQAHQTVEVIPDYCDLESGQCYGKPLRGWASPHLNPDSTPQAWSTAQTLTCITLMKDTISQLMHNDVLAEFGGVALSRNGIKRDAWDRLLDTDLGNPAKEDCRTIKDVLDERVITPFAGSINTPSYGAAYSAILFGPPGTAKTTICEALAQRMGWDFLVIDTAAFLADGLTNVAARIRYVFERLQALNECVILFDEIEEFCLDRETPGLGMESRMLTTAMLTAINDLRREKRSVFFLATNRLRAFDSAVIRPGRFDMQLFVGTPNLESRVTQLRQKLVGVSASDEQKQHAIKNYQSFLDSVWTEDAMFMNYLEGMQFATACANLVASGSELTEEEMKAVLSKQSAVMTVRGSVRAEYTASMELSRL